MPDEKANEKCSEKRHKKAPRKKETNAGNEDINKICKIPCIFCRIF